MVDIEKLKNIKFAHRGVHNNKDVPENSIEAFRLAIKKNYPIELDVHILKDNTLVVFHDDNLKRMTGIDKMIRDYDYKKLSKLKLLDTNYTIPTLDEVLKLVDGKVLLNVEIKMDQRVDDVCNCLVSLLDNYNGRFIIQSFYPQIIKWFKNNKSNYIRGLLINSSYNNKIFDYLSRSRLFFKYCSPNFLSVSKKILNKRGIQKFKDKGYPVFVWTIKNTDEITKYKDYADTFICNNLD